jgi:hypothetical protein
MPLSRFTQVTSEEETVAVARENGVRIEIKRTKLESRASV